MAKPPECPSCGARTKPIVWGFTTFTDVAEVGDAIIGGCVVDVDAEGRVAAFQCVGCGARADRDGVALVRASVDVPPVANPFSASAAPATQAKEHPVTGTWKDHIDPYSARDTDVPERAAPHASEVEPYSSRDNDLPESSSPPPESVAPYDAPDR